MSRDDIIRMALEALEYGQHSLKQISEHQWESRGQLAIDALRAALAQQAEPVEPVAWVRLEAWKSGKDWPDDCFTALPAEGLTPVYTAPPQRKPLTEEEIRDLWSWSMTAEAERTATTQQHAFTRAVERAHGIKENAND